MVVLDTATVPTVQSDSCPESRLGRRRNGLPDIFAGVNMEAVHALSQSSGIDMTTADDSIDFDIESDIDSDDHSEMDAAEAIYARPQSRRCALSDIFELITPAQRCELMNEYYSSLEGHSSDSVDSDCCERTEEDTDIPGRNVGSRRCALADIFQDVSPTERSNLLRNYYTCLTVSSEHRGVQVNSADADEILTAGTQQRPSCTVHRISQENSCQIQRSNYIDHKPPLDNMFPTLRSSSHFVGGLRRAFSLPDYDDFIFKSAKRCRRRNGMPDVSEGLSDSELNALRDRYFYRALVASV